MTALTSLASERQKRLVATSHTASRRVLRLWRQADGDMDARWSLIAPEVERIITAAQVNAARGATAYVRSAGDLLGAGMEPARIVPEAFGGATREGRGIGPELYAAVTTAKSLIGRGVGVGRAFETATSYMAVMAATLVRDAGRSADSTLATGRGSRFSVRVVQPGACSRCAILAGVKGWRVDFDRHPGCRCTSMPLFDDDAAPPGFYATPGDYFDSLTAAEQDRVFTKAGAEAIRLGANPANVVNARRGALTSTKRADGSYSLASLRPVQIGTSRDGKPLMVYATPEGTTSRSSWGRAQSDLSKHGTDRYRRSQSLRLMPEQIMSMSSTPERARELLQRYGYLY